MKQKKGIQLQKLKCLPLYGQLENVTYLMGAPNFTIRTDHKPLLSILDKKGLNDISNPRILRMKEKILTYQFTTEWIKGKDNQITDSLSRFPVDYHDQNDL